MSHCNDFLSDIPLFMVKMQAVWIEHHPLINGIFRRLLCGINSLWGEPQTSGKNPRHRVRATDIW